MARAKMKAADIQPVILCGGSGSRLWPVSRKALPKQFIRLVSDKTMLQDTALWVSEAEGFRAPMIVSNAAFRFHVADQMREIGIEPSAVILEPHSRNTTAAIALAALELSEENPDACMLVLPSDHVLGDKQAFLDTVRAAHKAALGGLLVTFGMHADRPETGYGYIRRGKPLIHGDNCFLVDHFVEKPDLETAERFLDKGGYHWNSGMFMFTARRYLDELRAHKPAILSTCLKALGKGERDGAFVLPDAEIFATAENISIDYAVMERTEAAAMVAASFGWSDVGSWSSLADLGEEDANGNVTEGDVLLEGCKGTFVRSSGRLVAAVGLEDQVIIETGDAVLVAPKDRVQDVRKVVERLRASKREEADTHAKVYRPWGTYESIHLGDKHRVKHIVVSPGGKLSSQYHHHRAEHWIIVSGSAEVTVGDSTWMMSENESLFIPVGEVHRLHNPGSEPMHLIEVQYGDYLGEDDIVRLDDIYGRLSPQDKEAPRHAMAAAE